MRLIFFTDLDGTLLDHETYDYSAALPALKALAERGIPLILASSKTAPEIALIRKKLRLEHWPAIVENGAGELPAGQNSVECTDQYERLHDVLSLLPSDLRKLFTGFGDMTVAEVVQYTGLSDSTAELAKRRAFTEPGLFKGTDSQQQEFVSMLAKHGVNARDGGRFLTLSLGRNKGDGLRAIAQSMGADASVALGDAPNDRELLLAATQAVVVRNDHSPDIGAIPGAVYTVLPGPAGWNEAVLKLLESNPDLP